MVLKLGNLSPGLSPKNMNWGQMIVQVFGLDYNDTVYQLINKYGLYHERNRKHCLVVIFFTDSLFSGKYGFKNISVG